MSNGCYTNEMWYLLSVVIMTGRWIYSKEGYLNLIIIYREWFPSQHKEHIHRDWKVKFARDWP